MQLRPAPELVDRFASVLDRLLPPGASVGLAVSGGPDSVALLLLAAAARPGKVEAGTVDHSLRAGSASEAAAVASLCERLNVPHASLTAQWDQPPTTAIQERARDERYRLLGQWMRDRGLVALATAHHRDDQAETFLMRLNRGAGVRGLGAIRAVAALPGDGGKLIRPLLGWSRAELEAVCAAAGVEPIADPSNEDERFERVRVRNALAAAEWLDSDGIARSAAYLGEADDALEWAAGREWKQVVEQEAQRIGYTPSDAPREIRRRIVGRAVQSLASEGARVPLRGREVDELIETLSSGGTATLRGVRCSGGKVWKFTPAPPRRQS